MSWLIKIRGSEVSSDDFTLEELEAVEKASGTPWSVLNAYREIRVAKAMLAVVLVRLGVPDTLMVKELSALTLRDIKSAFVWVPDEDDGGGGGGDDDDDPLDPTPPPPPTSQKSSAGASSVTTGRPKKHAVAA